MNVSTKQELRAFMEARFFCVIATASEAARPEAAFVAYTSSSDHEVIIGTSNKSRKFKNIMQNKSIALVIADTTGEAQYEGEVEIITAEDYETLMDEGRFQKLSGFDKYRNDPTQVYLKITPSWIRFIVHGEPDQITEFTEFA